MPWWHAALAQDRLQCSLLFTSIHLNIPETFVLLLDDNTTLFWEEPSASIIR
jgi:hypothetical protein